MTHSTFTAGRRITPTLALLALAGLVFFAFAGVASASKHTPRHGHARMHVVKNKRVVAGSFMRISALPAGVTVCNEAQNSWRGTWDATASTDPLPPARHKTTAMPVGRGGGLINAAENSPALALCVPADDGGGGTT